MTGIQKSTIYQRYFVFIIYVYKINDNDNEAKIVVCIQNGTDLHMKDISKQYSLPMGV